jgi:hypothetical protein
MSIALKNGSGCVEFIKKFTSTPPNEVYFYVPALKKCRFNVTKVMVRIASITDPLDWEVVYVYRKRQWHMVGGRQMKPSMARSIFTPIQVAAGLCNALVDRKGRARLEVDISFEEEDSKCDYVNWDLETDLAVVRGTRMGTKSNVLYLGRTTTFPHNMFECTSTELKFIYDFSTQQRISIWDPKEIRFQESVKYKRRHK